MRTLKKREERIKCIATLESLSGASFRKISFAFRWRVCVYERHILRKREEEKVPLRKLEVKRWNRKFAMVKKQKIRPSEFRQRGWIYLMKCIFKVSLSLSFALSLARSHHALLFLFFIRSHPRCRRRECQRENHRQEFSSITSDSRGERFFTAWAVRFSLSVFFSTRCHVISF